MDEFISQIVIDDYLANELIPSDPSTIVNFYFFIMEVRDRENAEINPRRTTMLGLKTGWNIYRAHRWRW